MNNQEFPSVLLVISPGEVFFQPDIEADEQIPTAHFFEL
jgi:hypothetical protein